MEWMILPLKRYAQFSGRSQRMEYWMFVLFTIIVSTVLSILDSVLHLGGHFGTFSADTPNSFAGGARSSGGVLSSIFSLAVLVPSFAVAVRRLHDIDRSGWWLVAPVGLMIVGVVAMIGAQSGVAAMGGVLIGGIAMLAGGISGIVLLVWFCMDGTRGPNRYGPDPKGGAMPDLYDTFR